MIARKPLGSLNLLDRERWNVCIGITRGPPPLSLMCAVIAAIFISLPGCGIFSDNTNDPREYSSSCKKKTLEQVLETAELKLPASAADMHYYYCGDDWRGRTVLLKFKASKGDVIKFMEALRMDESKLIKESSDAFSYLPNRKIDWRYDPSRDLASTGRVMDVNSKVIDYDLILDRTDRKVWIAYLTALIM